MRREQKKAQTRQKIVEAAMSLFEFHGYEATTVQMIADRAGVAKGTFFNYFNSKEDLIMDLQSRVIIQEMESVAGKPGPVIPRLQATLFEFARSFPINRSTARAVLQGIYGSNAIGKYHEERCVEFQNRLIPVLAQAQSKGEIRSDLSAETIAQLATQTYFGVLMSWALGIGEAELVDQMSLTFEVFVLGITR